MQATTTAPAPAAITDEEIVARIRAGETRLFELIMRRHNRRIFRAARAILRDDVEAEDVMQDAYVRAYAHLHQFAGRSAFSTWLTRIAVHEALARLRRERRFQPRGVERGEASASTAVSPEKQVCDREIRVLLDSAIDALSDEHRAVFVLRAVEEMSGAETAECLGIPEETVKTRLFRARVRLQEALVALEPAASEAYEFHLSRCNRVVAAVLSRLVAA